jgi:hypothetical protein
MLITDQPFVVEFCVILNVVILIFMQNYKNYHVHLPEKK